MIILPIAQMKHRHASAFTLIELLIVIAIIAILAAALLLPVLFQREKESRSNSMPQQSQTTRPGHPQRPSVKTDYSDRL
jgi:prepilin-type N-terminal cleavage/methylation domain-containing protein